MTMFMISMLLGGLIVVVFLTVLGVKAMRGKAVSGTEGLIGSTGKVTTKLEPEGIVYVNNEDYTARSKDESFIEEGAKVKVLAVDGAKVIVEKVV